MSKKSTHHSRKHKHSPNTAPQPPLGSSWHSAVISSIKETFLNHGVGGHHHSFDDELSDDGLWKKKLIWASKFLILAVIIAIFPFLSNHFWSEDSVAMEIFVFVIFELTAIALGISGIVSIKDAIKIRSNTK